MRLNGSLGLRKENPIAGAISHQSVQHRGSLVNLPGAAASFIFDGTLDSRITFTRSTTGTFVGSDGLIQTAAINSPRFDYDPATLAWKGLLIEEARTNKFLHAGDGSTSAFPVTVNVTVTASAATDPAGGTNALDVTRPVVIAPGDRAQQNITIPNDSTPWTISAYVLKGASQNVWLSLVLSGGVAIGASARVNISTGVIQGGSAATAKVKDAGDWWLISVSATNNSSGNTTLSYSFYPTGDSGTGSATIYPGQAENASSASSYIATTTASVTRAADSAVVSSIPFFNASEGTMVVEYMVPNLLGSAQYVFALDAGNSGTNSISHAVDSSNAHRFLGYDGLGANQFNINAGAVSANTVMRAAGVYKANDFAASLNGAAVVTDTSGTVASPTGAHFGSAGDGTAKLNGWLRRVSYYNKRLTNNELIALST